MALERRAALADEDVGTLTEELRTPTGEQRLRPVQALALVEALDCRGLIGSIRVGGGKTLPSLLLPTVFDAERPVLLVPGALMERTYASYRELRMHWDLRPPRVLGYQLLSHPLHVEDLEKYRPDLLIADEVHHLRNPTSACTRRVARYMRDNPDTIFCGLSGTLQGLRLMTYRHLAEWALGKGSPLPFSEDTTKKWDNALNPTKDSPETDAGALRVFFGPAPSDGLGKWIRDTPGFVATTAVGCSASIEIDTWKAPKVCADELAQADMGERPDGTPLAPAEQADLRCQLALGFWYRWDPMPPEHWLNARRDWCRFVREVLGDEDNDDWDSERLVRDAHPEVAAPWLAVKDDYVRTTVPVWLDHSVMAGAVEWARKNAGIVWSRYRAVGEALGTKIPHYGRGGMDKYGAHIEQAKGPISASIRSCGVGMNLQYAYCKNLIITPTPNAEILEQLIGRTHREGQPSDLVSLTWIRSIPYHADCLRRARYDAEQLETNNQEPQKLTAATYL